MNYSAAFVSSFKELFDGQRECHAEGEGRLVPETVTDELVRDHLEGRRRVGIYCTAGRDRDRCRWIFVDVHEQDWELAATLARRLSDVHGMKAHLERSKASGWHVWVFFASWVECWKARAAVRTVVAELKDRTMRPVEIVPDQDALPAEPADLHGRYAWLPLFGGDVARGRTCFYVERGGAPSRVDDWTPEKAAKNTETALDALLDGYDRPSVTSAYSKGEEDAPAERRVDELLPCATRALKGGARGEAVGEWVARLAVHLKRNGYQRPEAASVLAPWNERLCVPPAPAAELDATVARVFDPATSASEGLGCDHELVTPFCVRGECPVWRAKHLADNGVARPVDPKRIFMEVDGSRELGGEFRFVHGVMRYRVQGMDNRRGALFCVLTAEKDGETQHRGKVNLDSPRSRAEFERKVFERCKVGDVANDMMNMADQISKAFEKAVKERRTKEQDNRQGYAITQREILAARQWARERPNLLWHMLEFTSRCGVTREKKNRILVFFVGSSCKMEAPLSGIGKGDSASGKSFLASSIFKLMPEEDLVEYTRITGAALFYRDEYALQHKILFIREAPGSEGSEHTLRTFITDGDLKLSTVQKDDAGRNVTSDITVRGPMAFYTTTTMVEVNPENETRLLQVHADIDEGTTRSIFNPVAWAASHGSLKPHPAELLSWRNFQRVLERGIDVTVPYAMRLIERFPTTNLRARRDFARFIELIKVCAYIHQFHRERDQWVDVENHPRERIVASVADYAIVKRVVEDSMMRSAMNVKAGQERLVDAVRAITETATYEVQHGKPPPNHVEVTSDASGNRIVWIGTPAIREFLGVSSRAVRDLIHALEEQGVLTLAQNRKPIRVRLSCDVPGDEFRLPTVDPEELFREYPQDRAHLYDPLTAPDFDDIYQEKPRGKDDDDDEG